MSTATGEKVITGVTADPYDWPYNQRLDPSAPRWC